mgnify:CR=1 FL=1
MHDQFVSPRRWLAAAISEARDEADRQRARGAGKAPHPHPPAIVSVPLVASALPARARCASRHATAPAAAR